MKLSRIQTFSVQSVIETNVYIKPKILIIPCTKFYGRNKWRSLRFDLSHVLEMIKQRAKMENRYKQGRRKSILLCEGLLVFNEMMEELKERLNFQSIPLPLFFFGQVGM